jgi:hypothetical protein
LLLTVFIVKGTSNNLIISHRVFDVKRTRRKILGLALLHLLVEQAASGTPIVKFAIDLAVRY